MQIPEGLSSPVNKALYRLSLGDMTCREMVEYLSDSRRKNTGFPLEVAERVVSLLKEEGFLDDKRYLKILVRRLDEKGYGPRKIRQELVRHGFPRSYIERVEERRVDFTARAKSLLEKDGKSKMLCQTPEGRKKLMDSLVRKGYDYTAASEAVNRISEEDDIFRD